MKVINNFTIRSAKISDVPFLVDTIIEAEKAGTDKLSYATIFQISEEETRKYITEMLLEEVDGCELSISSFLVAEKEGQVAAALSAWIEGNEGISSSILKGNLLNYTLPKECIKNAMQINSIIGEIHIESIPNTIQIGAGYVAPVFRGNALLGILNTEILKRLKNSNSTISYVYAQIFDCNIPSIKTYEKANFEVVMVKESLNKTILNFLPSNKKFLLRRKL